MKKLIACLGILMVIASQNSFAMFFKNNANSNKLIACNHYATIVAPPDESDPNYINILKSRTAACNCDSAPSDPKVGDKSVCPIADHAWFKAHNGINF